MNIDVTTAVVAAPAVAAATLPCLRFVALLQFFTVIIIINTTTTM